MQVRENKRKQRHTKINKTDVMENHQVIREGGRKEYLCCKNLKKKKEKTVQIGLLDFNYYLTLCLTNNFSISSKIQIFK